MRKTKILATLGPSSSSLEMITKLIQAGMDAARINMSHGTQEGHKKNIELIREASKLAGKEISILADLQGPKIRVSKLPSPLILEKNQIWHIVPESNVSKMKSEDKIIPTVYEAIVDDAHVGAQILFDDGLLEAIVEKKWKHSLEIKIKVGGVLKSNKGINLPDVNVSAPSLTEKDEEDLLFALKQGVQYVALSFVRTASDIKQVRSILHRLRADVGIVAKIEKPEALINLKEIIAASDMIMIARGDMGVEVGNHLVPAIQKQIITTCNEVGIPVITATQMLESMITNARPTRAEASDVANAIWDGTDVVMLSGETASGQYPLETVEMMGRIVEEAEKTPKERPLLRNINLSSVTAANQVAASLIAEKVNAAWIVSITERGNSCLKITRFRPKTPVLGITKSIETVRRMSIYWGIRPMFMPSEKENASDFEFEVIQHLKETKKLTNGEKLVITHGDGSYFKHGTSNSVRVEIVKDIKSKNSSPIDFQEVETTKARIILDTRVCASCQHCISACPYQIWHVAPGPGRETRIDPEQAHLCMLDNACVDSCPTGAIEIIPLL
ncbi:MAG: pyruvate kinase [Bacteriovoracaceae bacterium]|nr:pyruvate kinase [Bacteriovoracaceae bacterium]